MNILLLFFLWLFKLAHFTFILLNKNIKLVHLGFLILNCQLLWAILKIQFSSYVFRVCMMLVCSWASVCARLRWWVPVHLLILKFACKLLFSLIEGLMLEILIELRAINLLIFIVESVWLIYVFRLLHIHIINILVF